MDVFKLQGTYAINKPKKHQLLDNFFLYSLAAFSCILLCSSPFWFPSLFASIKLVFFVYPPKIASFFLSSKFLFIVGNLIIIVLVGESKFFASNPPPASDVYYEEYIKRKRSLPISSSLEEKKEIKIAKSIKEKVSMTGEGRGNIEGKHMVNEREQSHGDEEPSLPTEELNKRADDFIARVNRRLRLEAGLVLC